MPAGISIASYSACSIPLPFTGPVAADLAEYRRTLRHDLRTPINAIKGYGEMLREDAADGGADALVSDLDKLLGEATLLLDRIDGLVTFSGSDAPASDDTGAAATEAGAPARIVESLLKAVRPITEKEADRAAIQPSRILVVDDNVSNRDLLSRRLQRQGHTVLQAEDGTNALAMIEKEVLDLVLLDLMMPGISGYDVLTLLKGDPQFREIPVIVISALTELDSIVRCIEVGADDYLAKPFDPVLLRARVGSSLEKKHLRDRERAMVEALRVEKERSEQLLLNILPKKIVARMHDGETVIADQLSNVTILFSDLVGFTKLSSRLSAADLVRLMNELFSEFDRLALKSRDREDQDDRRRLYVGGRLARAASGPRACGSRHGFGDDPSGRADESRVDHPTADAYRDPFGRRGGRSHRDAQIRLRHLG